MPIGVGATSKGISPNGNATSVTSAAVTTAASGSTIVLALSWGFTNGGTFATISDNKGNTYTQIGTELVSGNHRARLYYCENAIGGTGHTATFTINSADFMGIFFLEITGGATSGILDKNARQNDTTSPFTSGATATTAQANEMLVGFVSGDSGSNPATHGISGATPSTGWTIQAGAEEKNGSANVVGAIATNIVSATGAYTAGFTESGSSRAHVFIATFKEAAAAPKSFLPNPAARMLPLLVR